MVTRRDYRETAAILSIELYSTDVPSEQSIVASIARSLADVFAKRNPAFRFDKFYQACGLTDDGYLKVAQ